MSTASVIGDFINEELLRSGDEAIGQDDELIASGLMDSLTIIRLVHFIEEEFSVSVSGGEVVPKNFSSVGAITSFIDGKLAS